LDKGNASVIAFILSFFSLVFSVSHVQWAKLTGQTSSSVLSVLAWPTLQGATKHPKLA